MNLPNKLTILRTILVPVFIVMYLTSWIDGNQYYAAGIFVIASLTDFFDGYLARKYKTPPMNIEHNIRTVINTCWETNKKGMDEIAGYPLVCKPTNSEFIDMVAYYLSEEEQPMCIQSSL